MRRGLRVGLATTLAAGVVVLGAGTASASGGGNGGDSSDGDDGDGHQDNKSCSHFIEKKGKPLKESDFPSDHQQEAYKNLTKKDIRDRHGDPYYIHGDFCDDERPWRGRDWDDDSYKTFKNKIKNGEPVQDKDDNTYADHDGYNKQFRKDEEKDLEPDHVGAPKNPRYRPQ